MEQCAFEIFHHHVKDGILYDTARSGYEWWVQLRPSPPAGRYSMLKKSKSDREHGKSKTSDNRSKCNDGNIVETNNNDLQEDEEEEKGICFHWDKDEDLRLLMGGNMYVHPHLSTVTYFTGIGAPTMALNYCVNSFTGEYILLTNNCNKLTRCN